MQWHRKLSSTFLSLCKFILFDHGENCCLQVKRRFDFRLDQTAVDFKLMLDHFEVKDRHF